METNESLIHKNRLSKKSIIKTLILHGKKFFAYVLLVPVVRCLFTDEENSASISIFYLLIGLMFLYIAVVQLLKYFNTFYYLIIEERKIEYHHGIMNKEILSIPFEKIQDIQVNRHFIDQILGINKVILNTVGSEESDIELDGLDTNKLEELREVILNQNSKINQVSTNNDLVLEDKELVEKDHEILKTKHIILFGLTQKVFKPLLIFFGAILGIFQDFWNEEYFSSKVEMLQSYFLSQMNNQVFIFLIVGLMISLGLIFNILYWLQKYYRFRIERNEDNYKFSFGLFNQSERSVQVKNIQSFSFRQNWIQNRLKIGMLNLHQRRGVLEKNIKDVSIPGIWMNKAKYFIEETFGNYEKDNITILSSPKMKLVWFLSYVPFSFVLWLIPILNFGWIIGLQLLTILWFWYLSKRKYKNYQLVLGRDFIANKWGIFGFNEGVTKVEKVEQIIIKQYFWQKKSGLANISFCTSGMDIDFKAIPLEKCEQIINRYLVKISFNQ